MKQKLFALEDTKRDLFIFDVDGTLALCEHRQHFLEDKSDKSCWDKFFEACDKDQPNQPIIKLLNHLSKIGDVLIWTGRSDLVREKTIYWLERHTDLDATFIDSVLTMAEDGDKTTASDLKRSWLLKLSQEDRSRLVCVFEDCNDVVAMWREMDITCCQVQLNEF